MGIISHNEFTGQDGTWSGVVVVLVLAIIVMLMLDACTFRSAMRTFYCIVMLALVPNMYLLWNTKILAESGVSPFGPQPVTANCAHLQHDGMHKLTAKYPNGCITAPGAHAKDGHRGPISALSWRPTTPSGRPAGIGKAPKKENKQYHNVSNIYRKGKPKKKTQFAEKNHKKGVGTEIKAPPQNGSQVHHKPFKDKDVYLKQPFKGKTFGKKTTAMPRNNLQNQNKPIKPSNLKGKKTPLAHTKLLQGRANNIQKKHQQNKSTKASIPPKRRTKLNLGNQQKGKQSLVNPQHIKAKDIPLGKEKKKVSLWKKRNIKHHIPPV